MTSSPAVSPTAKRKIANESSPSVRLPDVDPEKYYNTEVYPPILTDPVDHDFPEAKIYGALKPCPELIQEKTDAELKPMVDTWLARFNAVLNDISVGAVRRQAAREFDSLFTNHAAWRDHLALGWDFHTFNGLKALKEKVIPLLYSVNFENVEIDDLADHRFKLGCGRVVLHAQTQEHAPIEWIQIYYSFENKLGFGKGVARLAAVRDPVTGEGTLRCLTFYTVLDDLKASPERVLRNRPEGVNHGPHVGRKSWLEEREREQDFKDGYQPPVLIVGGGQGGLTLAARLKSFGVNSLIIEKNKRVGDNWRNRYKFLVLHDPVWYDEMPYVKFPPTWPVYTPKDKLGDWFDNYAKSLDLNVRCDTTVTGASFDEINHKWKVKVRDNVTGAVTYYKPIHLVMATGHSGQPRIPKFEGQEQFQGRIVHSSQHGSGEEYKGGKALVIGGCNSAHDICQDFYEQGVDVTMLQRSSTCIITSVHGTVNNNKELYDEDGPQTDTADFIYHSMPIHFFNGVAQQQYRLSCKQDSKLLHALNTVGFKTNSGYGGTGLFGLYFRVGSGYYIDVGCSPLIIRGKVKLKQGVSVKRFLKTGVEFTDGTKLEGLDIVVLATGFTNMRETARRIFGDKVTEKLKPVWGLDREGEFKTMWRDSGHPNFWYMGGNLALARYYSKRLALQMVAQLKGISY